MFNLPFMEEYLWSGIDADKFKFFLLFANGVLIKRRLFSSSENLNMVINAYI